MKDCEAYTALLDPYIDGELPPEESESVRSHLSQCPDCQRYVRDALAIRAAFPTAEDTAVPNGFTESVMAAVRASDRARKPKRALWALLPLAACLAAAVLLHDTVPPKMQPATAGGGNAAAITESASAAQSEGTNSENIEDRDGGPLEEELCSDYDTTAGTDALKIADSVEQENSVSAAAPRSAQVGLVLTAEQANGLLDGYTPVRETETERVYELTSREYAALLDALAERGEAFAAVESGTETVEVVVTL